jgi:flagellar protein FliL
MAEGISVGAGTTRRHKSNLLMQVMSALVAVSLATAGWFWHHSNEAKDNQLENGGIRSVLHLESFVVNLSGATDNAYIRIGIELGLATDQRDPEKQIAFRGRLRDTILSVLGTRTVEELLTPEGKTKLKEDLLKAIDDRVPEIQCREIYFTEFLVQH